MTGLILKLSYNNIGETPVEGGITGSFFFLTESILITAYHVISKHNMKPNQGFKYCQYWLIKDTKVIIELSSDMLTDHKEIDTTIITLKKIGSAGFNNASSETIIAGSPCYNHGFIGGSMPKVNAMWGDSGLIIKSCDYSKNIANGNGFIVSNRNLTVKSNDVNITDVVGFETSYGGVQGMSGGPLISKASDKAIGMMSFGLPVDVPNKTSLFAVSISEILKRLNL